MKSIYLSPSDYDSTVKICSLVDDFCESEEEMRYVDKETGEILLNYDGTTCNEEWDIVIANFF